MSARTKKLLVYTAVGLILVGFIGPIIWFAMLAIRPQATAFSTPPVFVFRPQITAFEYTFSDPGINRPQLWNSIIVAGGAVLLNLPFSVPAAYALSRFRIKGKKYLMLWYISLLMAPPVVFLIPFFIFMTKLGLRGTHISMIIIMQTLTVPFSIWLLKSFIDEIPESLEDAAKVDGAGLGQVLRRVTLPLVAPGLIVTSLFAFVFAWNNAVFPLVLSNSSTTTLPLGTLNYFATSGVTWNYIAATAVAAMLPPMIIFLVLDKFVVRGLTFGAVKG
jgi:multiple sugar transport system permease protein